MFSIAICDDEELFCSQLERYLELLQKKEQVNVEIYYSGEELYRQMCGGRFFDLIFLDIKLKTMSGVTLAEKIRNEMQNEKTHIVFVSGQKEYAMELFAVRPLHFLIKPVGEEDVISVVKKGMELSSIYSQVFEYRTRDSLYRKPYDEILYFESAGRKTGIETTEGRIEIYGKLGDIEREAPLCFIRTHNSFLVNDMYIRQWSYEKLILTNGMEIPISPKYRKEVRRILFEHLKEK